MSASDLALPQLLSWVRAGPGGPESELGLGQSWAWVRAGQGGPGLELGRSEVGEAVALTLVLALALTLTLTLAPARALALRARALALALAHPHPASIPPRQTHLMDPIDVGLESWVANLAARLQLDSPASVRPPLVTVGASSSSDAATLSLPPIQSAASLQSGQGRGLQQAGLHGGVEQAALQQAGLQRAGSLSGLRPPGMPPQQQELAPNLSPEPSDHASLPSDIDGLVPRHGQTCAPRAPPAAALEAYSLAQGCALWAQDHTAPAVRELRSGCGGALTPVQRRRRRCVLTTQMPTAGSRCSDLSAGADWRIGLRGCGGAGTIDGGLAYCWLNGQREGVHRSRL